jgi:PadR family transcriptional regulator PadR
VHLPFIKIAGIKNFCTYFILDIIINKYYYQVINSTDYCIVWIIILISHGKLDIGKEAKLSEPESLDKKFQKELNGGITALILLSVLNNAADPMYGYQIAKLIGEEQDDSSVKQGVLYPALRSLENNGLLSSSVEPSVSSPPRRYYQITEMGRETLSRWQKIWQKSKKFVDSMLQTKP